MKIARRRFLRDTTYVTAGFLGLARFTASPLLADQGYQNEVERTGKLIRDPHRVFDLPEGFEYTIISKTGDPMRDGLRTPGSPDGMAAFPAAGGRVVLVRNHEITDDLTFIGPYGVRNELFSKVEAEKVYDAGRGVRPQLGGTTTLVYDPAKRAVENSFLSLAGTARNCAGGPTPWGTWVTCEETVIKKCEKELREQDHGYAFEVPATETRHLADPIPLREMGRFNHEAIAVDPRSGVVYETEDRDDGLLYRYLPNEKGKLAKGGRLQALQLRGAKSADTRNWPNTGKPKLAIGEWHDVEWIDMEEVEAPEDDLRKRGHKVGAARFARGEGIWYGGGLVYIACTNGGIGKVGQVFAYEPSPYEGTSREASAPGRIRLFLEPNNTYLLQYGDNLTVAPWGDVVICEDGAEAQYLRGITPEGKVYTLGRSAYSGDSELCGICFAPDHPTAFVNLQRPGFTLAITGPWHELGRAPRREARARPPRWGTAHGPSLIT